jgi:hypothetical protein
MLPHLHQMRVSSNNSSFSNLGDLVLDCFSGSGTTLAIASQLECRWIGIDNNLNNFSLDTTQSYMSELEGILTQWRAWQ